MRLRPRPGTKIVRPTKPKPARPATSRTVVRPVVKRVQPRMQQFREFSRARAARQGFVRLGAMPPNIVGSVVVGNLPAIMTAAQNASISQLELKLKRKLTKDEKLGVIADVQRTFGRPVAFDAPIPGSIRAAWEGIKVGVKTAAYRATIGLPQTATDVVRVIGEAGGKALVTAGEAFGDGFTKGIFGDDDGKPKAGAGILVTLGLIGAVLVVLPLLRK